MKSFWLMALLVLSAVEWLHADPQTAAVQEALKARGFYYGEIHGENNNETAAAITRFQVRSGLEVTGELNEETLRSLGLEPAETLKSNSQERPWPRAEAWRALREQDRKFLEQTESTRPIGEAREVNLQQTPLHQIRDFVAGFVVAGISEDVEAELQFYAEKADYYENGVVSKDFIRKDILRYNQKWPIRRYWLDGEIEVLNEGEADPLEVRYQIKYVVENQQRESRGTAVKTLKLKKVGEGLEITSVREKTLD